MVDTHFFIGYHIKARSGVLQPHM